MRRRRAGADEMEKLAVEKLVRVPSVARTSDHSECIPVRISIVA